MCWGTKSLSTVISVAQRSTDSELEKMSWHAGSRDVDSFTHNPPWPLNMIGLKFNLSIHVQSQNKDIEPNLNQE